jgi:dihydroorotase
MDMVTLPRPTDAHLHLRDGAALEAVLPATARQFARAVVMPNLKPPVVTAADAAAYRARILAALPAGADFTPLMTLYLTDHTHPDEIGRAVEDGVVGVKLYPAGATTNSAAGVTDLSRVEPALAEMARLGLPLLVHGEVTDPDTDIFDREGLFLDRVLAPLLDRHPDLRVVLEHVTTAAGVAFVRSAGDRVAGTLTAHHLLVDRNALFVGGIRPHYYCLPILKRRTDREALLDAATSGDPSFFLGTDSAPHAVGAKESACGCAGCYTAHAALELYAEAFDQAGALDRLPGFASAHAARFYDFDESAETVTLTREPWSPPDTVAFGEQRLVPWRADAPLQWRMVAG